LPACIPHILVSCLCVTDSIHGVSHNMQRLLLLQDSFRVTLNFFHEVHVDWSGVIFAHNLVLLTVHVNCLQGFVQCSQLVSHNLILFIQRVPLICDYSVRLIEVLGEDLDPGFYLRLELLFLFFVLRL
jgi:hypothetical protein